MKKIPLIFLTSSQSLKRSGGIETWLNNILKNPPRDYSIYIICPYSPSNIESKNNPKYKLLQCNEFINLSSNRLISLIIITYNFILFTLYSSIHILSLRLKLNTPITIVGLHTFPTMISIPFIKLFLKNSNIIAYVRGTITKDIYDEKRKFIGLSYFLIEKIIIRLSDHIFSNGKDTAAYLMKYYNCNSKVLLNGVNTKNPSLSSINNQCFVLKKIKDLKKLGFKIVLTLGTIRAVKGIDYVISSIKYMQGHSNYSTLTDKFAFVFVGKGQLSHYRSIVKNNNLNNVYFLGETSNIFPLLDLTDFAFAVSGGGGISHSAIELQSRGIPTIAWNNLTYSQIIKHNFNGILVKDKSTKALANGLIKLLKNPNLVSKISNNSISLSKKYDWEYVKKNFYQAIYSIVYENEK